MIDLIKNILEWHKNTFPEATEEAQEKKLVEEFSEYVVAVNEYIQSANYKDVYKIKMELADIIITAINLLNYPEIVNFVNKKMDINRNRVWGANHHIEETEQENAG